MHTAQPIISYRKLAEALGPWLNEPSLRAADNQGRLPLTRHWHEGRRAFDPAEVAALRENLERHGFKLPRRARK